MLFLISLSLSLPLSLSLFIYIDIYIYIYIYIERERDAIWAVAVEYADYTSAEGPDYHLEVKCWLQVVTHNVWERDPASEVVTWLAKLHLGLYTV